MTPFGVPFGRRVFDVAPLSAPCWHRFGHSCLQISCPLIGDGKFLGGFLFRRVAFHQKYTSGEKGIATHPRVASIYLVLFEA